MMFKYVNFTGASKRPTNIFIRFLNWRFIILSTQYPPGRKHRSLAFSLDSQTSCPFSFDEFLTVFSCDTTCYVRGLRMLVAMLINIIAFYLFANIYDLNFQSAIADFTSSILIIWNITLYFIVHPNALILPIVWVK